MMSGFRAFLVQSNALALAVGVIIGIALGTVVSSLVNDVIMPPVGLAFGGIDFASLQIVLKEASGDTPAVAIRYGLLVNAIIAFVVVALVAYWIYSSFVRQPEAPSPAMKECPFCHESILAAATRCRYCTSELPA
jgi:large conductance mechanosensitive channel